MKKRIITLLLSGCMCCSLFGCGGGDEHSTDPVKAQSGITCLTENIQTEEMMRQIDSYDQLSSGVNTFAMNMYRMLPEDSNCFFSPYSIVSALSMLDVGAGGKTKEELEKTLGISNLEAWNYQMQSYVSRQWSDETFVTTANSIWMDNQRKWANSIEDEFLYPVKNYYGGDIYEANFGANPDDVVEGVNKWVSDNTNDMIPSILSELPSDVVMMLINAVYFEGKWSKEFDEKDTMESVFHGTNGDKDVDMMHTYDETYAYIDDGSIKGVSLPYRGENVVMKVFIPSNTDGNIGTLVGNLDNEQLMTLINSFDEAEYKKLNVLQLPKFEDELSIEGMDDLLQNMGIKSAYSDADLSKISEDMAVSSVNHRAKIIVDECGTKAAAVTDIMVKATAMPVEEIYNFIVDQPFFYVIEDMNTNMILFMGRVNNL